MSMLDGEVRMNLLNFVINFMVKNGVNPVYAIINTIAVGFYIVEVNLEYYVVNISDIFFGFHVSFIDIGWTFDAPISHPVIKENVLEFESKFISLDSAKQYLKQMYIIFAKAPNCQYSHIVEI